MNNKKLIALLLAAMMSVSTASVAFAAPEDVLTKVPADRYVGKVSSTTLCWKPEMNGNDDGKLTEGEAAAITPLTFTDCSLAHWRAWRTAPA